MFSDGWKTFWTGGIAPILGATIVELSGGAVNCDFTVFGEWAGRAGGEVPFVNGSFVVGFIADEFRCAHYLISL